MSILEHLLPMVLITEAIKYIRLLIESSLMGKSNLSLLMCLPMEYVGFLTQMVI